VRVGVIEGAAHPLSPALRKAFAGVDWILFAGGIRNPAALEELCRIAPVTAVVGHRDFLAFGDRFPETAELELAGARILLTHLIGSPPDLLPPIRRRMDVDPPDIVVHGHAAQAQVLWLGGTLFLCPGCASPDWPGRPATCGMLEIAGPGRITAHILSLN
jgi:predicted phosphodiesterase